MITPETLFTCMIGGMAMGGVIIGAAVLTRLWARVALTLVLGVVTYLLFHTDKAAPGIFHTPGGDFVAFAVVGLGTLGATSAVFGLITGLRDRIAAVLSPQLWDPQPAPPLSPEDFAKRWFVTVAAATGGLIGGLAGGKDFLTPFLHAFSPTHILFTLVMAVVSITLIGPVEEYIFGAGRGSADQQGHSDSHASHFESVLRRLSWRATGRLALVVILIMQLNILHVCLEETVSVGDPGAVFTMVLASLAPAIATYFWSASLQRGAIRVAPRATAGALLAGYILLFPVCAMALIATGQSAAQTHALTGGLLAGYWAVAGVLAVVTPAVISALNYGAFALVGGWVLDAERRRTATAPLSTVAKLTLALAATYAVGVLIAMKTSESLNHFQYPLEAYTAAALQLLSMLGWGVGLLVSGFPDILRRAASPEAVATDGPGPSAQRTPIQWRAWLVLGGLTSLTLLGIVELIIALGHR